MAVLLPVAALADQSWTDAPDGNFYSDALEWATVNGMTKGCDGGINFCPDRGATRAESITFAKRYDDLVVQPALDDIRAEIAANPGPQGADGAVGPQGPGGADAESPDRLVWVADDGTGNFLLLSTALASIVDASASNPYVVRIAPGEYTETATVALKTYVDVEGSGQGVTTITCECGSGFFDASAAAVSAGNIVAEIRHLTINNTGGDTYSTGVWTEDVVDGSVSMTNVTATATSTGTDNYGVFNYNSSPSMTNVTATASGGTYNYGVYNNSSSPSMTNVTATASGGNDSYGVVNDVSSSPTMMNVIATATGGTNSNYGVYNYSSSPSMTNVTASATGGTDNRGVYNNWSSSPSMTDVTASATGGTNSYGVYNNSSSSPSMMNVTASATGGTNNVGVQNYLSSSPTIRNSSITGSTASIYNIGTGPTAVVAYTLLEGGAVSGTGFTCLGAYDENLALLNASCVIAVP